ncbi:MAG: hypothetical protein IT453_16625 [Planctomycetes bacterium]|nr:hypothetical protein [Planctomycetota bacterium]
MHPIRFALARSLATLALAGLATAQQNSDKEIFLQFAHKYSDANGCSDFDLAYTPNGHLIAAFVEERITFDDRLIVAELDPITGTWLKLVDSPFYMERITGISLAVPTHEYGDPKYDRWYCSAIFSNPNSSGSGPDDVWVGIVSGIQGKVWGPWITFCEKLPHATAIGISLQSALACVPLGPSDWSNGYALELVFSYFDDPTLKGYSVWRATSLDQAHSFSSETLIAGANAQGAGTLRGAGNFWHPTVAADERNASLLVAFEDVKAENVLIAAGATGGSLALIDQTPANDGRPEFAPCLAVDDTDVNLTCRAGSIGTSGEGLLTWYVGTTFGGFVQLPTIHARATSAGDIAVHEGDAYIAATVLPDNNGASRCFAFEGDRDSFTATLAATAIQDSGAAIGSPRVAITPEGVMPFRRSYAWRVPPTATKPRGVWLDL